MPQLSPPNKLDNSENEKRANWILTNALKQDFNFPSEFYECTAILWRDSGVQVPFFS